MIGPKQDQEVHGSGTAIQAAGNVQIEQNYHGLQVAEVRELTEIFLDRQLPALRAEAVAAMRENTEAFISEIVARLAQSEKVTQESFAKPDAQVCFNEALKGSAEKGGQIDLGMLADMVIGRLESDNDPLIKLIYEDSIKILPRLTGPQIEYLAYLTWMRHIKHGAVDHVDWLESIAQKVLSITRLGADISKTNKEYMASVGVITINLVTDADNSFTSLRTNYSFLPEDKEQLAEQAPALYKLLDCWAKSESSLYHLNGTGKLIGLIALQKVLGKLNLAIWIN